MVLDSYLCIKFYFHKLGVSFFVYGEIIDTYTLKDPRQREFVEAGSDYIKSVTEIGSSLPLYRIFPTKPYRRFVSVTRRMKKAGTLFCLYLSEIDVVCWFELGGEILKNRIEKLKQTDSSHDEQAVGKMCLMYDKFIRAILK